MIYRPDFMIDNIFLNLVKAGADVNIVYPEDKFKPAFKKDEVENPRYNPQGKYLCTPIITLIRLNPKNEIMRSNLIGLIEHKAKINIVDSDGRDPIMHAIMSNNEMVLTILLENKRSLEADTDC